MERKDFLKTTALAAASGLLGAAPLWSRAIPLPVNKKLDVLGLSLFSVPKMLEKDLGAGLELLWEMGFRGLELYGPYPFSAPSNKEFWKQTTPMLGFEGSGFFGKSEDEFAKIVNDIGFSVPSLHTDLDTLLERLPFLATAAHKLGASYLTLPSIPPARRQDMAGYKQMADTFNKIGAAAKEQGLRFAYHNHGYGLQPVSGIVPFEMMIEDTDPELVYLEMDIFWTTAGRVNPIDYLKKYAGRYKMLHLKDMKELRFFSDDGGDPSQWIPLFPYMTSAGDGVLALEPLVDVALKTGVDHFFVEQDMVADPESALGRSYAYLNGLN
ncbi:sugar phosphate isomerase/epimerase family protein [Robiginitalea sp. IMCC43444]|uniref:sugar phosphate isomerase/epimerase family protein n=1 Tax=Robiginitalea sp. IMCC43444 TaxID=3459121 RepID=UPI00404158E1